MSTVLAKSGAVAWADLSTGLFAVSPLGSGGLADALGALSPKELLCPHPNIGDAEIAIDLALTDLTLTPLAKPKFSGESAKRRLEGAFGVSSLDGFGAFEREELSALGALYDYLEQTQVGKAPRLNPPKRLTAEAYVSIDPATRSSLEIERTQRGERKGTLLAAIDRTLTPAGGRALAARLARPLTDLSAINARQDAVAFLREDPDLKADWREVLKGSADIARALSRLLLGRGSPRDLGALAAGLKAGEAVNALIAKRPLTQAPQLLHEALTACSLAQNPPLQALARDLDKALSPEPAAHVRDGGFIAPGWLAALDEARKWRDDSRRLIAGLQTDYQSRSGVSALKIKHNNVLGYFIEVSAKNADALMNDEAFIHRQTLANAVRFTTPELGELESKIASAAERALSLEKQEFEAFTARASALAPPLQASANALAELDVSAALAEWAGDIRAVRPQMDNSLAFDIQAGRHPVVEAALKTQAGNPFTPNNCQLDGAGEEAKRLLFVTGPNMAGKSTFLRQNALMILLAQSGAPVPATSARIGIADKIFSRVGAADDLARGRSTFMAEMIETAAILNQAGPRAFVILDEIGRGTATYDGLSIAWATAEHLHNINQCRALFATHYHEMTQLDDRLSGAGNICLRAREWEGDLVFLHEVGQGAADRSYGVEVAKRAGLPECAVTRAKEVLSRLEGEDGAAEALSELPLFAITNATGSPREALEALYALKSMSKT